MLVRWSHIKSPVWHCYNFRMREITQTSSTTEKKLIFMVCIKFYCGHISHRITQLNKWTTQYPDYKPRPSTTYLVMCSFYSDDLNAIAKWYKCEAKITTPHPHLAHKFLFSRVENAIIISANSFEFRDCLCLCACVWNFPWWDIKPDYKYTAWMFYFIIFSPHI